MELGIHSLRPDSRPRENTNAYDTNVAGSLIRILLSANPKKHQFIKSRIGYPITPLLSPLKRRAFQNVKQQSNQLITHPLSTSKLNITLSKKSTAMNHDSEIHHSQMVGLPCQQKKKNDSRVCFSFPTSLPVRDPYCNCKLGAPILLMRALSHLQ